MKYWRYIYPSLLLLLFVSVYGLLKQPDKNMHIIACDVGQGDAFLIIQGKNQILIDGGKGRSVLDCLGRHIPFWDRDIEVVLLTHPQKDHYEGLIYVFESYNVKNFFTSKLDSSSKEYRVLQNTVGGGGVNVVKARGGMRTRLGLIYLDIVWPTQEFTEKYTKDITGEQKAAENLNRDINDFSVVAILSLGEINALFTGDIGPEASDLVASRLGKERVEYIKVPHHGSKNGISRKLLEKTQPYLAVISSGKGNSYGHPHKEVLDLLSEFKVVTKRTDELGDFEAITDGKKIWYKK